MKCSRNAFICQRHKKFSRSTKMLPAYPTPAPTLPYRTVSSTLVWSRHLAELPNRTIFMNTPLLSAHFFEFCDFQLFLLKVLSQRWNPVEAIDNFLSAYSLGRYVGQSHRFLNGLNHAWMELWVKSVIYVSPFKSSYHSCKIDYPHLLHSIPSVLLGLFLCNSVIVLSYTFHQWGFHNSISAPSYKVLFLIQGSYQLLW